MGSDFIVIDAGPIVALLNDREEHHRWAIGVAQELDTSFVTSEVALSEAFFLLADEPRGTEALLGLLERESIGVMCMSQDHMGAIAKLMRRYADQPMSLADATLVRFSELHENVRVFTIDKHFRIYRRNGRQQIPLIIPDAV